MTEPAVINEIRIVCDQQQGHSSKRATSLVTVFKHLGSGDESDSRNGRWSTLVKSKRVQREQTKNAGSTDTGLTLTGNDVYKSATHGRSPSEGTRSVYQIECAGCSSYPVSAREETLFGILNILRHAGIQQITLRALAARVSSKA
jgi:hypothetical protein